MITAGLPSTAGASITAISLVRPKCAVAQNQRSLVCDTAAATSAAVAASPRWILSGGCVISRVTAPATIDRIVGKGTTRYVESAEISNSSATTATGLRAIVNAHNGAIRE